MSDTFLPGKDHYLKSGKGYHLSPYAPHPEDLEGMTRTELLRASPRMFDSAFMERFSHTPFWVPLIIYVPVSLVLIVLGFTNGVGWSAVYWMPGAALLWTGTEYFLHRVVFHFDPGHGFFGKLHWFMHGVHHDHPNDPTRLVMPPAVSIPLAIIFVGAFYLIIGYPSWMTFGGTFLACYITYDMTHYYTHHAHPRSKLGKYLREWHLRHHFQAPNKAYGVTSPTWDYVFHSTVPHVKH